MVTRSLAALKKSLKKKGTEIEKEIAEVPWQADRKQKSKILEW